MNIDTVKNELMRDEGLRLKPYRCTANKLTIGYGRNLEDKGITQEEAEYLLIDDITQVIKELDEKLPWWVNQTEVRRRALINMAFQLGINGLLQFKKMLQAIQDGNYREACLQGLDSKWAKTDTPQRAYRITRMILEG